MSNGDPLQENLERIKRLQGGVQEVWDKIPLPDPYKKVVASWVSLEVVLLSIVGAVVDGLALAVKSQSFLASSAILLFLHAWWLIGEMRSARPVSTQVKASETCRFVGCANKPTILGFCPLHAAKARGCYRMLKNYNEGDHDCFFGRDEMVAEVLGAVTGQTLTLLVGESGVGKSSLVRAGVNPTLPGLGGGGYRPIYINCRDVAADPLADLDTKCGPVLEGDSVLVELDQFEQLLVRFPERVRQVIDWVKGRLAHGQRVLISMRCDYVDDIDAYHDDLPDIYRNRVRLNRFTASQASEVMGKSASYEGVTFPDDLKAKIVEDLATGPVAVASTARISPAELQIICSRLVTGTSDVTLVDYKKRGGRVGLLEEYLLDTIDCIPTGDRQVARHVLFELARRSTISQRVDLPTLAKTAPQPARVGPVLKRLEELGFVNPRQDCPDGADAPILTYELTHEYLIPLIRKFVHETNLDYYQCKIYFDQMQLELREGVTPPLGRLLRVSLRLYETLTEPERGVLRAMWRRSIRRRVLPASVAGFVALLAGVLLLNQVHHNYFLAADFASRTKTAIPAKTLEFGEPDVREQIPIVVNRVVPWLPLTVEACWDSGYFLDELSDAGNKALKASPRVSDDGRAFELIIEPLLAGYEGRTMILLNTGREGEALDLLRGAIATEQNFDERSKIYRALATLGSKDAATTLFQRYETIKDVNEQLVVLHSLLSLPQPEGDDLLAKALDSDKLRLGSRLDFLNRPGDDLRTYVRHASALKRLAGSQSDGLRGTTNLVLKRCGMPCDYAALRALRTAIQKDRESFNETEAVRPFGVADNLSKATSLALCTESLSNCIEAAPMLAKALGNLGEDRIFLLRGDAAVVKGLKEALDDPRAARHLFNFVRDNPKSPKAAKVCEVLSEVGGRHVVNDLLTALNDVAAIPSALQLLRHAGPDQLKKHRAELIKLARSGTALDVRSRLYATLALVRIAEPAGFDSLRVVLATQGGR